MRKQVLGAIALTAALATAPVAIGRAVTGSGPGTAENNISIPTLSEGFAVDENGKATAASSATFELIAGKLTLDQVPNYDFGQANISEIIAGPVTRKSFAGDPTKRLSTYDGQNYEGTLSVSDYRGNNAGWTLTAQSGNFKGGTGTDTLDINSLTLHIGAPVTVDPQMPGELISGDIAGTGATAISAEAGHGAGNNTYNSDASLDLAQNIKAVAGDYEAVINWTLGSTPTPAAPTQP
ncbi:WxL domain-containing protein [Lacticaseibacillus kribbianus]|uniref:WxL domain-containing protein n=1 Tax=Lacticaseibacillus kribbianus TaxID=2926292 RepID=UPI001CD74D7C|nr:WxL domain-containing protein [Lacticaseibacillus kribbianus]